MARRWDWRIITRILLAAIWMGNGLEKFGMNWPAWLQGGTGDVPGMLAMMAEDTPVRPVAWLITHLMLPFGGHLTLPVGLLEVTVGLALLIGLGIRWAGLLGALIQSFFWLGFLTTDWPFQYPLLILAHLALAVPLWLSDRPWGSANRWLWVLTATLAAMWAYEGQTGDWRSFAAAALLLAGLVPRATWRRPILVVGAAAGIALTVGADRSEQWGSFVWAYYTVFSTHLAVLVGQLWPDGLQRLRA